MRDRAMGIPIQVPSISIPSGIPIQCKIKWDRLGQGGTANHDIPVFR